MINTKLEDAIAEVEKATRELRATYPGMPPHEWYVLNGSVAVLYAVARGEIGRLSTEIRDAQIGAAARALARRNENDPWAYWHCPNCGGSCFGTAPIDPDDLEGPRQIFCSGPGEAGGCNFTILQDEWNRRIGRR